MLAKSFAQKVDPNSSEMNQQLWKKIKEPPNIEMFTKCYCGLPVLPFWGQNLSNISH
jgi:hypothetical protein